MSAERELLQRLVEAEHDWNRSVINKQDFVNVAGRIADEARALLAQPWQSDQSEIDLAVIRNWPEGFATRMDHVWRDVIGFIPNVRLYDLQRMLAEFGFTMSVYERATQPKHNPMRWTYVPPTVPGHYWHRSRQEVPADLLYVEWGKSHWIADYAEPDSNKAAPAAAWGGQWCGPIEPPKDG